jgi:hypothetical protein
MKNRFRILVGIPQGKISQFGDAGIDEVRLKRTWFESTGRA